MTWYSLADIFMTMLPLPVFCSPSKLGINQNHSLNGILFTLCSQYDYEHGTTEMVSEVGWCLACFETQWHKIKKEEEMVAKKKKDPKLVFYFN